jgi:hypothetical protein
MKLAAFLLLAAATTAAAQAPPTRLTRVSTPITVDGRLDDPAWQTIAPLPLTMYKPVFGGTPTQRTEIRVAYDDDYFYAGGWFYDTDPSAIRINSLYRDRYSGDDAFAIYLDVFNDNRSAKWFGTTPAGVRFELLVSEDGAVTNGSWDTFWDAKTTLTNEGWFAEVRIPFSSLGFQAIGDSTVMGLTVTRLVARLNQRVTFPAIDPRFEFRQPSVAHDVVLTGVRSSTPLYVTPYALTGLQQKPVLPSGASRFERQEHVSREAGVDVRYPLTSELTLDVTANTDFAQVEADDQQVNLDRFSLFFPEKRRFFQERSELFDFTMGNTGGRLFHSRQIGLAPSVRVPVLGGARLVGRIGQWNVGVLDMLTESAGTLPSENFGVLRASRRVLNPFSTAGAMLTSRTGGGERNVAYGLDTDVRLGGDTYLQLRFAQTFDSGDSSDVGFFDRAQHYINLQRRVTAGLQYALSSTRSGADYRPELGFLPRRNFTTANAVANYYILTDKHKYFSRIYPGAIAFSTFRNTDNEIESGQYAFWVQWDTKQGGGGWLEPKWFVEDVVTPFRIGNAVDIPAGTYRFADFQVYWFSASGRKVRTSIDARAGTYFDGKRQQLITAPTWNVSPQLELGADYQLTRLQFPERNQRANIQVARLRVRGALNARASANAFVQYNSTTDEVGLNVRMRYNFAEGTDLWLVYDEALDTERALLTGSTVRSPLSTGRALVLKYTHTFEF